MRLASFWSSERRWGVCSIEYEALLSREPMQISPNFRNLGLSQIVAVSERARAVAPEYEKRTGKPFIYFQRGEVGYPTPPFLAEAFAEAFAKGATKYPKSGGEAYFKDAVIADLQEAGVPRIGHENIVATYGGQEGLQLVFSMFRGARVAGFTPCWSCIFDNLMPYADCTWVPVQLRAESNWSIDFYALETALQSADIFYLNTPHNPTGRVFSAADIINIAEACAKYGVLLVCDDAYAKLTYGTRHHYAVLRNTEFQNIIVVNTFSKSLAATGLRIGYAVSRRTDLIERMTLGDYSQTAGVSTPTQYAVSKALRHPDLAAWHKAFLAEMEKRAKALQDNLAPNIGAYQPEGAFYLFLRAPGGYTEERFVRELMNDGIAVVPGSAFGMSEKQPHVRLSFSTLSAELIAEGARRFGEVYSRLK